MWEPSEPLPEDFRVPFLRRPVDLVRIDKGKESLALLFEKCLKATLACKKNTVMQYDVMRAHFPGLQ